MNVHGLDGNITRGEGIEFPTRMKTSDEAAGGIYLLPIRFAESLSSLAN